MKSQKFILAGAVALIAIALTGLQMMKSRDAAREAGAGACAVEEASTEAGCSAPGTAGVSSSRKPEQFVLSQASAERAVKVSDADRAQLKILNEVLASRNDNDPRLDRELRVLSPGARGLLRARYNETAAEKRNERGTIVFLLGRNLETAGDFEFLSGVVNEPPCRSLSDCQSADPTDSREDAGHELGIDVTLNYPQIVALKSLDRLLAGAPTAEQREKSIQLIRQAMGSPVRAVSGLATELYNRYGGKSS